MKIPYQDFQLLFHAAPGLYLVLKPDFTIVEVSEAYLAATMTQRDAIIGKGLFEVFPDNPSDPAATGVQNLRASLERVKQNLTADTMAIQKYDVQRPQAEGGEFEERYWSPINSPVLDKDNQLLYIIHRVQDVTDYVQLKQLNLEQTERAQTLQTRADQMEAEIFLRGQELQQVNSRLNTIINGTTEAIASIDTTGKLTAFNKLYRQYFQKLFGQTIAVEMNLIQFFSSKNNPKRNLLALWERAMKGEHFHLTEEFNAGGSDNIIYEISYRPILDNQQIVGAAHIIKDITEQKKAENAIYDLNQQLEARVAERTTQLAITNQSLQQEIAERKHIEKSLRESEERLNLALEAAQIGIWQWDIRENKLTVDERICRLFGLALNKPLQSIEDFMNCVYSEDKANVKQALTNTLNNNVLYDIEYRVVWPDKSIHFLGARGQLYRCNTTGKAMHITGVCWDITQRKHVENWLFQHQKELAQVAQNNSMTEMASALAHELNQPLTVISTYTQLCLQYLELDNYNNLDVMQGISEAVQQAERAGKIIHRIKNLMRKRKLELESVNIDEFLQEILMLIRPEINDFKVDIQLKLESFLRPIAVDKIQLQQVILNLLRNSIEAMRDAKTVFPCITVQIKIEAQESLIIQIIDTGPGISEDLVDKILEPYFTTKPYGMGMGLAICRTIVQAHGGELSLGNSANGEGTCIQLTLPVKEKCDVELK